MRHNHPSNFIISSSCSLPRTAITNGKSPSVLNFLIVLRHPKCGRCISSYTHVFISMSDRNSVHRPERTTSIIPGLSGCWCRDDATRPAFSWFRLALDSVIDHLTPSSSSHSYCIFFLRSTMFWWLDRHWRRSLICGAIDRRSWDTRTPGVPHTEHSSWSIHRNAK